MRRTTSALRTEDILPCPDDFPVEMRPLSDAARQANALHVALAGFTNGDLNALEDELDFYAFTGMAGPRLKALMKIA